VAWWGGGALVPFLDFRVPGSDFRKHRRAMTGVNTSATSTQHTGDRSTCKPQRVEKSAFSANSAASALLNGCPGGVPRGGGTN
jgi:hypothetical protein